MSPEEAQQLLKRPQRIAFASNSFLIKVGLGIAGVWWLWRRI